MSEEKGNNPVSLKLKAARTLKWNSIDRFSAQIIFALVGIVLANELSQTDFGLAGAILIFQGFALLFVDSGFGAALLQKKVPTQADYSTVFWFNLFVSLGVYVILWFCAPLIALIFHSEDLIPMSRVMFLAFIINGLSIVQTNRLMKMMDVKMVALSNVAALVIAGIIAVWMALNDFGAWALVWQTVIQAAVRCIWLWATSRWYPSLIFSKESFRSVLKVGTGVFSSSFLNTVCLNIYSFVIGAFYNLATLGVYTQADKWSKMGVTSLSQIFTSTFVPVLSEFQNQKEKFAEISGKVSRMAAFMVFPFMGGLVLTGSSIFHTLFGNKWDAAIILFQILCARGIFLVMTSLYNNFLLSMGKARALVVVEIVKDTMLVGAIFATVGFRTVEALVWGQLASAVVTYIVVLIMTSRLIHRNIWKMLLDLTPYAALTLAIVGLLWPVGSLQLPPSVILLIQLSVAAGLYWLVLRLAGSKILAESQNYVLGRLRKK